MKKTIKVIENAEEEKRKVDTILKSKAILFLEYNYLIISIVIYLIILIFIVIGIVKLDVSNIPSNIKYYSKLNKDFWFAFFGISVPTMLGILIDKILYEKNTIARYPFKGLVDIRKSVKNIKRDYDHNICKIIQNRTIKLPNVEINEFHYPLISEFELVLICEEIEELNDQLLLDLEKYHELLTFTVHNKFKKKIIQNILDIKSSNTTYIMLSPKKDDLFIEIDFEDKTIFLDEKCKDYKKATLMEINQPIVKEVDAERKKVVESYEDYSNKHQSRINEKFIYASKNKFFYINDKSIFYENSLYVYCVSSIIKYIYENVKVRNYKYFKSSKD